MLDPRFPAAIGRRPHVPGDPSLNLSGTVGPNTLWPDAPAVLSPDSWAVSVVATTSRDV